MIELGVPNCRALRYKARHSSKMMFVRWLRDVVHANRTQVAQICDECEFLTPELRLRRDTENVKSREAAKKEERRERRSAIDAKLNRKYKSMVKRIGSRAASGSATDQSIEEIVREPHKRHQTRQQTRLQKEQRGFDKRVFVQTAEHYEVPHEHIQCTRSVTALVKRSPGTQHRDDVVETGRYALERRSRTRY